MDLEPLLKLMLIKYTYTNSLQIAADTPDIDGNTQCRETDGKNKENDQFEDLTVNIKG